MTKHAIAAFLAIASIASAVPAPYPLTVDSQNANAPLVQLYRASPRTIRVQFTDGGTAADLTGLTTNDLHLTWSTSNASPAFVASDAAIVNATNGQADFTFTSGDLNYAQGRYIYEAAAGSAVVKQGVLVILGSPFATGTNAPAFQTNQNLSGYTFSNYPWITDANSDGTTYGRKDGGWVALTSGGGSSTDTTARAWAQSASNLAVLALGSASNAAAAATNAHTLAATASNLAASVFAWGNHATNGYLTTESDPLWSAVSNSIRADINSKGTGTVGSLSGVAMQGGTYTGDVRAATSAGGALANMSGSNVLTWGMGGGTAVALSGALTINGGSTVATGTPVYVESDTAAIAQVGAASNALNAGVIAVGVTASNLAASSVKYQDTRGFTNTGGARFSGAITADGGLSSTGSIRITNGDESNTISNTGIVLEGGGANPFRIANQIAQVSGTTVLNFGERRGYGSWTLGGEGAGELSGSVTIYASNLVWWNTSLFETGKLNAATLVGVDGSGLTNLPGGGAITALSTNLDAAENIISNVHIRGRSFVISDGLTVSSGTTNCFIAQPGVTIGLNARQCSVLGAGGIVLNGTVGGAIGGGTNNSVGGVFSVVSGGKDNQATADYTYIGGGAQNKAGGTGSTVGAGWWNTNEAAHATIGGGRLNRINAGGVNAVISGGGTNLIDSPGGQIIGSSGWLTSTASNSVLITAAPTRTTNAAPNTVSIVAPASFSVRVGATTFAVSTGGVSGAVGTGTWSITESGLIVNGVAK